MDDFVRATVGWLAEYVTYSTLLVATAWIVTRSPRLSPAVREVAWRLAVLGGVVVATGTTLENTGRAVSPVEGHRVVEKVVLGVEAGGEHAVGPPALRARWSSAEPRSLAALDLRPSPAEGACAEAIQGTLGPGRLEAIRSACAPPAPAPWYALAWLWLLGAAVGLAGWLRALIEAFRLRAAALPAGPRAREMLAELDGEGWVRSLLESDRIAVPCALLGRIIVLPSHCVESMSDAELRATLAHELAHVGRRDVAWTAALRLVVALCWFQPLSRLAVVGATTAREEACDDWAVSRTGEPGALAASIYEIARSAVHPLALSASIAGGARGSTERRVRRILGGRATRSGLSQRLLVGVALALPLLVAPRLSIVPETRFAVVLNRVAVDSTVLRPGVRTDSISSLAVFVVEDGS